MSNTLVMNSLNLGMSPTVGDSVYSAPSQKAVRNNKTEGVNELPKLPDTTSLEEDKTFKLKWNNTSKLFEWVEE